MLKTILIVTIMASDLLQVEQAYRDELDYRVVRRGSVSGALAASWNAATLAGRDYVILQPSSNEQVYLRFIEDTSGAAVEPMKTEGWNAVEILVQDPDALAPALDRSEHFNVVGRPRYLTEKQNIKAMQATRKNPVSGCNPPKHTSTGCSSWLPAPATIPAWVSSTEQSWV